LSRVRLELQALPDADIEQTGLAQRIMRATKEFILKELQSFERDGPYGPETVRSWIEGRIEWYERWASRLPKL
jgi:hypothetical protein